jgi:hypothetical protein
VLQASHNTTSVQVGSVQVTSLTAGRQCRTTVGNTGASNKQQEHQMGNIHCRFGIQILRLAALHPWLTNKQRWGCSGGAAFTEWHASWCMTEQTKESSAVQVFCSVGTNGLQSIRQGSSWSVQWLLQITALRCELIPVPYRRADTRSIQGIQQRHRYHSASGSVMAAPGTQNCCIKSGHMLKANGHLLAVSNM